MKLECVLPKELGILEGQEIKKQFDVILAGETVSLFSKCSLKSDNMNIIDKEDLSEDDTSISISDNIETTLQSDVEGDSSNIDNLKDEDVKTGDSINKIIFWGI